MTFWWWIVSAVLHGTIIFYLCFYGFSEMTFPPEDNDTQSRGRMVSVENQATLVYTMIINVIFIKLFFELDGIKEIAVFFVIVTIASYYGLMYIFSTYTISKLVNRQFFDLDQ